MSKKKQQLNIPRSIQRMFPELKKAVDATKSVQVSVSKRDCDNAEALNPSECALARATKREFHADAVVIGMSSSYIIKDKKAIRFATPERVRREIVSFDRNKDFAPGDYQLVPKSPSNRIGSTTKETRKGRKDKSAKRIKHRSARVRFLQQV